MDYLLKRNKISERLDVAAESMSTFCSNRTMVLAGRRTDSDSEVPQILWTNGPMALKALESMKEGTEPRLKIENDFDPWKRNVEARI